uniref:Uncharacterized protein n=1 Tax=Cyprinus carpio carpio TaxID=630221 RepID=A0A9J8A5E4_CYPCA
MNIHINPPTVAYIGQTGVSVQPTVFTPAVTAVPDYFFYSIFTTVFCCLPLGIAALIHSCYVSIHSSRTSSASYVQLRSKVYIHLAESAKC